MVIFTDTDNPLSAVHRYIPPSTFCGLKISKVDVTSIKLVIPRLCVALMTVRLLLDIAPFIASNQVILGAGRPTAVQVSITFSDNTFVTALSLAAGKNDGGTI